MVSTRRPALRAQIVVLVVAVLVAGVGAGIWSRTVAQDDDDIETVALDRAANDFVPPNLQNPDFDGEQFEPADVLTADGETFRLESDGRPMVVNFWYSTCGPCSRELKWFGLVSDQFGDAVRFVGVNPRDKPGKMVDYAADRGVDYELYLDDGYAVQDEFDIVGYPLTLFIDADGTIVRQTNELTDDELAENVEALLG